MHAPNGGKNLNAKHTTQKEKEFDNERAQFEKDMAILGADKRAAIANT